MNEIVFFSQQHGALLIQLLLAQVVGDIILRSGVERKHFSSKTFLHLAIIFISSLVMTRMWLISFEVLLAHWLIESVALEMTRRNIASKPIIFIAELAFFFLATVGIWAISLGLVHELIPAFISLLSNYHILLILFGYVVVIWPVGNLIKLATHDMTKETKSKGETEDEVELQNARIEHGGKRIGQFERIIILTFVLLQQYEAIGFLITGKSIIRFAQRDENLKSEYVLVGTMMSYACSIIVGVVVNWFMGMG